LRTCDALIASSPPDPKLDEEQRKALQQLLQSSDRVILFRGGAGTGKSFVLGKLVEAVQSIGRPVTVLAPQRQQVADLKKAEFPTPTTVAGFLIRGNPAPHSLVVVDEAGQIGGKQMYDLVQLVQSVGGRLVLSGDTRQHGPVEASDALVAIERYSGIQPVELHTIRRQDPRLAKSNAERRRIAAASIPPHRILSVSEMLRIPSPTARLKRVNSRKVVVRSGDRKEPFSFVNCRCHCSLFNHRRSPTRGSDKRGRRLPAQCRQRLLMPRRDEELLDFVSGRGGHRHEIVAAVCGRRNRALLHAAKSSCNLPTSCRAVNC